MTTTVTQTQTETGGSTGNGTAAGAPCDAGTFLSVLKPAMDSTAGDLTIVKVKVTRCQNDYAFVLAIPDNSDSPERRQLLRLRPRCSCRGTGRNGTS